ncbi:MAG: alpha/beta hydrolase [Chitinophagaceae bacterium]|nr:alpha/beta hydrolase [Chitinophagaceae bacterium]
MKKKILRIFRYVALAYVLGGAALYIFQDAVLFHPVTLKRNQLYDFPEPHREIDIPINGEDTLNVVDFEAAAPPRRGVVLYFHGNKKNISWYHKFIPYFTRRGYRVIMIDYPGYGKSRGKLTEQKLYNWALLTYKFALASTPADSIIIYGKSMGTGIAAYLASVRDCKRLILETPYYDFPSVVEHYLPIYPVRLMLHYRLPTAEYLRQVRAPVSIFHGTRDRIVTYRNAKRLQKLFKPGDELITIPNGKHNNLFQFPETLRKLDSLLLLP